MNERDQLAKLARKSVLLMSLPTLVLVTAALLLQGSDLGPYVGNLLGGAVGWLGFTTILSLHYIRREG